jgi:hypothetical protein
MNCKKLHGLNENSKRHFDIGQLQKRDLKSSKILWHCPFKRL